MRTIVILAFLATELFAAPLTTYDQRQDGDFNVHAHLENFVIVLIPSSTGSLLDLVAKSNPGKIKHLVSHGDAYVKHISQNSDRQSSSLPEKTSVKGDAVEANNEKNTVSKVHLEISAPKVIVETSTKDLVEHETVIAQSPSVIVTKPQEKPDAEVQEDKASAASVEETAENNARKAKLERLREGLEICSSRQARDGATGCRSPRPQTRTSKEYPVPDFLKALQSGLSAAN